MTLHEPPTRLELCDQALQKMLTHAAEQWLGGRGSLVGYCPQHLRTPLEVGPTLHLQCPQCYQTALNSGVRDGS